MNPLFERMAVSIFERMSLAAAEHGAVNLGQGFPDFGWPDEILAAAARFVTTESNQYAPSRGLPVLRDAIAAHYNRHHGLHLATSNICVTSGATEAIAAAIFATVEPGDEVIVLTPAYDAYAPLVRSVGGIVSEVALEPRQWRLPASRIEGAITSRTRAIIFNNPHNPTGRLFDADELNELSAIACKYDLVVISDEVWEHVLFDGRTFTPLASLPGMAQRTLKCGSAGKIFALTGWKIGWLAGDPEKVEIAARAHQFLTFSSPPALQSAVAFGLAEGDPWLKPMRRAFAEARDEMKRALTDAGFAVLESAATYFLCIDLGRSNIPVDGETFAEAAVERAGAAVVPLSAFSEHQGPSNIVRICFAKNPATRRAGIESLIRARTLFT